MSPTIMDTTSCPGAAEILQLVDAMVLGPIPDPQVRQQLIEIESWCKYLVDLLRDQGRDRTQAAVIANQATEIRPDTF